MWPAAYQDNPHKTAKAACTPEICPERALNAANLAKAAKNLPLDPKSGIFSTKSGRYLPHPRSWTLKCPGLGVAGVGDANSHCSD